MNKKNILLVLITCVMMLLLSGCIPDEYTQEEKEKREKEGKAETEAWFSENLPNAKLNQSEIIAEHWLYGATKGYYELDGESYQYIFEYNDKALYDDRHSDELKNTLGELYAEKLGLRDYEVKSVHFYYEMPCVIYEDEERSGNVEVVDSMISYNNYLPYDFEMESIDDSIYDLLNTDSKLRELQFEYTVEEKDLDASLVDLDFLFDNHVSDFNFDITSSKDDSYIAIFNVESGSEESKNKLGIVKGEYVTVEMENGTKRHENKRKHYWEYDMEKHKLVKEEEY